MQTLTEKVYELTPPCGLFNETVVYNLFPNRSEGALKAVVHRAVHSGEVLRLKPGLYCLAEIYRKAHPHPFVLAGMLHSPSHVSLESALHYHGLIPEAVYEVASVITQRMRRFETPLGNFSFQRVPSNYPKAGVRVEKIDKESWAFIATPLRAIADLVYLRREVNWQKDGLRFLVDAMRIEEEDLAELSMEDYEEVYESIRNLRVKRYIQGVRQELRS
jgi:predicted transcriptional regulator of viral defense system